MPFHQQPTLKRATSSSTAVDYFDRLAQHEIEAEEEAHRNLPAWHKAALALHYSIVVLVLVSSLLVICETVPQLREAYYSHFKRCEMFFTFVFTLELLVRLWVASNRCEYLRSTANLIDTVATIPWYVEWMLEKIYSTMLHSHVHEHFAGTFMSIRLLRVLRLAKAARHFDMIHIVIEGLWATLRGLGALVAFIGMGAVFSATTVYFLECEVEGSPFTSIPATMWWSMATITSVGYGDWVPQTLGGKCVAAVTMVWGILITAVCNAIITTTFIQRYMRSSVDQQIYGSLYLLGNGEEDVDPRQCSTRRFCSIACSPSQAPLTRKGRTPMSVAWQELYAASEALNESLDEVVYRTKVLAEVSATNLASRSREVEERAPAINRGSSYSMLAEQGACSPIAADTIEEHADQLRRKLDKFLDASKSVL